jgi:3-isopropylmalate/(R)-2-methylmalate dehydratase small subunit
MKIQGSVFLYADNVDTDVIIPARYLNTIDPAELASHCMEDLDATFVKRVKKGDLIVAGRNFGCGSSREHAPIAIKAAGIACVIAQSFARIFYRNAINIGLPILECPEAVEGTRAGDVLAVDFDTGRIENQTRGQVYQSAPFPPFMKELMAQGGLVPYVRSRLASRGEPANKGARRR